MIKTFEDFLKDCHAENYHGTDDDMSDAYEAWLENLDIDFIIDLATRYGSILHLEGQREGLNKAQEIYKNI